MSVNMDIRADLISAILRLEKVEGIPPELSAIRPKSERRTRRALILKCQSFHEKNEHKPALVDIVQQ